MVARNHVFIDGALGAAGEEKWSVGFAFSGLPGAPVTDPDDLQDWANAIGPYLNTAVIPGMLNLLSSSGSIRAVRTYYYPGPGPALAAGLYQFPVQRLGTGTISKPPQCSAVFSLLTPNAGRRYRGRFYWPWLSSGITTGLKGQVPGGTAVEASAVLNQIAQLGQFASPDLQPAVYSRAGDFLTPVSSVRVGDVVDTQRRRRDSLTEVYQTATV